MSNRALEILLVEDNPGDVRLTKEALKEGSIANRLTVARDGVEAIALLRQEGAFANAARPDMILLDLNLPKKDGREVLAEIKVDEALRRIPVVILSTSQDEGDIARSYDLHANCYISKPVDLDQFIQVVKAIEEFWLGVVDFRLPEEDMDAIPIRILLVEDNPGDVRLTREALRDGKVHNELVAVPDGVEALAYLRREGPYADAQRPDVILLDLNLPKKDGREVLAEIKRDEKLQRIPVVILTTSKAEEDILRSYALHANCYITKPVDLEQFITVVRSIEEFWFSIVRLPSR